MKVENGTGGSVKKLKQVVSAVVTILVCVVLLPLFAVVVGALWLAKRLKRSRRLARRRRRR